METRITLTVDTREPWPHPWARCLPEHVQLERRKLDTGDFALAGLSDGAVVERKTVTDLLGCIGTGRDRFERELVRGSVLPGFVVVVEGHLSDLLAETRAIHPASIIGTVAAWQRRYCGFVFAGRQCCAAEFAWRYLAGQVRDAERATTPPPGKESISHCEKAASFAMAKNRQGRDFERSATQY